MDPREWCRDMVRPFRTEVGFKGGPKGMCYMCWSPYGVGDPRLTHSQSNRSEWSKTDCRFDGIVPEMCWSLWEQKAVLGKYWSAQGQSDALPSRDEGIAHMREDKGYAGLRVPWGIALWLTW